MVETTKCDHCGADARFVVTKEFDGRLMNFCCRGCLGVYEIMREELMQKQNQNPPDEKDSTGGLASHSKNQPHISNRTKIL